MKVYMNMIKITVILSSLLETCMVNAMPEEKLVQIEKEVNTDVGDGKGPDKQINLENLIFLIEVLREDIADVKLKFNGLVDEINGALGGLATRDLNYVDHQIDDLKNRFKMMLNNKATIPEDSKVGKLKTEE